MSDAIHLLGVQKQCSTFPMNNNGTCITLLKTKFLLKKKKKPKKQPNKKNPKLILLDINLNQHWRSINSTNKDPYYCHIYLSLAIF